MCRRYCLKYNRHYYIIIILYVYSLYSVHLATLQADLGINYSFNDHSCVTIQQEIGTFKKNTSY